MKPTHCTPACLLFISAIICSCVFLKAQPPNVKRDNRGSVLSIAYFVESANNSINSLTSLLKKDNYRNKIATLNNPANNELGFSLKNEILTALKPLLEKAKKTDGNKFTEVVDNLLGSSDENGLGSIKKYLPPLGIFSSVLSMVGNLVIHEKSITREDLNTFINRVQQYFVQYEKMNFINQHFAIQVEKLANRSAELKDDIKDFLLECILTLDKSASRNTLRDKSLETLAQKYYDPHAEA